MTLSRNILLLDAVLKTTAMEGVLVINFGMNFLRVQEVLVLRRAVNGEFVIAVLEVVLDVGSKVMKLDIFKVGLEDGKLVVKVVNSKVVFDGKVVVVVVVVARGFKPHLFPVQM